MPSASDHLAQPYSVDEVALPLTRVADDHMFRLDGPGRLSCRVQVLTGAGAPVLLFTQMEWETGVSLMNRAETLALHAWRHFLPDVPRLPVVLHLYIEDDEPVPGAAAPQARSWARADVVEFASAGDGQLVVTDWPDPPTALANALDSAADTDRGSGYEPHVCLPPDYVDVWVTVPAAALPPTQPFREGCLSPRPTRAVAAPGQSCCWYHQQDWAAAAAELAERLRAGTDLRGDLPPAIAAAVRSLVIEPVHLSVDDQGAMSYSNGQHRCQAMKDQAAPFMVATIVRPIADPPLPGELAVLGPLPPACC